MTTHAPPLSTGVKLSFGIGQIAEGIKTSAFSFLLMFYYNQVLGLPANLAGLAIGLALMFDAVTDPVAGSISDRWQSKYGRRHPFIFMSAIPLGISFWLLFSPWVTLESAGQYGLFAWMLALTIATRGSMTLYHVPHMALGAELSQDYDERTVLVAIRHFFGAVGFLVVFVLGFGYYFAPTPEYANGQLNAAAYPPFAIVLSLTMVASVLITGFGTTSRIPYMVSANEVEARVRLVDVIVEAYDAMKNESFRWMMFGFIVIIVAFGISAASGLYMYTFFWELTQPQILLVLVMAPLGSMLGYAFSKRFFVWLDKRDAMIVGAVAWMVIHAIPVGLYLLGWVPALGSWSMAGMLVGIGILGGMAIAQIVVGIGTAMADIADENELLTGRRQEGVFFGASAFANKCSAALGSMLAGMMLTWIEWPTGVAVGEVPSDTVLMLGVITGPITSLLVIPGILCLTGYRLNRTKLTEIQTALAARSPS